MPDKPSWTDRIPDLLETLREWPNELLAVTDVAKLLDLSNRRAQEILKLAGGTCEGKSAYIEPSALGLYLESKGGPGLATEERARRRRLASKILHLDQVHKLYYQAAPNGERVEVVPELMPENEAERQLMKVAARCGVAGLPSSIQFSPGCLTIRFRDLQECLQLLFQFSLAVGKDYDYLDSLLAENQGEFQFLFGTGEPIVPPDPNGKASAA